MYQTWARGKDGSKHSCQFWVETTDYNDGQEPTGIVEVSIEILTEMLIELGYFKEY